MARTRALTAALVFITVMALPAAKAEALTVRDVVELSKAGLSDDVLLALIEVDRTVFTHRHADAEDVEGRRRQRARDHRDDSQRPPDDRRS